jgi:hypothetical protein
MKEKEVARLLADRLCWLELGQEGMRYRHNMQRALGKKYQDTYDKQAETIIKMVRQSD